ncbi:hypothetical protein [Chishuiella sp.]|uniref:hypothetical protein n=1 Tax=Chishuiella sp. TaxID=1969467 RepID=UPI0028A9D686|nr:hypothetical protein [Chishuiella sp.]
MKRYNTIIVLIIAFISIFIFLIKNNETDEKPENKPIVHNRINYPQTIENGTELKLKNGKGSFNLFKEAKQEQRYYFRNNSCNDVSIQIVPATDTANIRINNIISPSKNTDGPFGRNIDYGLSENGVYEIVIGESLMKGYPFQGNYTLNVQLK